MLEYLIRQYQINERNTDALMEACLMYHDTEFFLRLLNIINLDSSRKLWLFLNGFRGSRYPISRKAITEQISSDPKLLEFVGKMVRRIAETSQDKYVNRHGQSVVSWYTTTVITAMEVSSPTEDFLRALFPQILTGLSSGGSKSLKVKEYIQ